jgi:hypothetical protein
VSARTEQLKTFAASIKSISHSNRAGLQHLASVIHAEHCDLAIAGSDFLRWFREFIGNDAYKEIRSDALDNFVAQIKKAAP